MTAAVAGVTTVASARAGVRTQWPARSPAQARPRVGRSRVALVTRAAKKSAPKAPVEAETVPAEAPSPPRFPPGACPPPRATCLLVSALGSRETAPIASRSRVRKSTAPPPTDDRRVLRDPLLD